MAIVLTDFEQSQAYDGDAVAAASQLQDRLQRLQLSQVVHNCRAIILLEGWEGAGKRSALRQIAGAFDPCRLSAHCSNDLEIDDGRHWLAPYWSRLPRSGETAMFLRGWYGGLIDQRAHGEIADKAWARAFDEINEFEAQQTDHGTLIVKLFFHIGETVQAERLRERSEDPWRRWTLGTNAGRSLAARKPYHDAYEAMFKRSHTRWAGWTVIDAGNAVAARLAAMGAVAAALEKGVPAKPPKAENLPNLAAG